MRRQIQNNSHISKSKKSPLSKKGILISQKIQDQSINQEVAYFQGSKTQNSVSITNQTSSHQQSNQSQESNNNRHLDRVSKIIQDLYDRHQRAKQKLQRLRIENQKSQQKECYFTPTKNKLHRYPVYGDVVKRNQIWLKQKLRKGIQLKQSLTLEGMKQCTFFPNFQSRRTSERYLKSKSRSKSQTKQNQRSRNLSVSNQIFRSSKKQIQFTQYEMAKRKLLQKFNKNL